MPHVLASGAEFFFFSVVLVDVSAEDIYWKGGEGEREREREKESRAHSSDKSRAMK